MLVEACCGAPRREAHDTKVSRSKSGSTFLNEPKVCVKRESEQR